MSADETRACVLHLYVVIDTSSFQFFTFVLTKNEIRGGDLHGDAYVRFIFGILSTHSSPSSC